jgi:predicted dehydrogenase
MTNRIGVALIGAGMIAERHVSALSASLSRVRLVAVVSRHPERARHLAQHYEGPSPLFTSDLSKIVSDPTVQVAIVATPPNVRIDLIKTLALAGKHVLLEKPVARNVGEAEQVVEICQKAGVVLGVLFQHRMRESSLAAHRILRSGTLGEPGHIEIAVPLWRAQSYYDELDRGSYARDGGGVLITQAIHTIDLALSLVGPVLRVQAMTATTPLHQMESEDFAVAGLQFANSAVGSLVASTASYPHRREIIRLHCQNGSMCLEPEVLTITWRDGRIEHYPSVDSSNISNTNTSKTGWHQRVIDDFLDALRNDREPMVSGYQALASHRLIEAIESSSREGAAIELAGC